MAARSGRTIRLCCKLTTPRGQLTLRLTITHRAFFGTGKRDFALTDPLIAELEHLTDTGIGALFSRVARNDFRLADLVETIRLGLIGGGTCPEEAARLVNAYARQRPLAEILPLALDVLDARWSGVEDIRRFKDAQGQYLVTDPKDCRFLRLLGNPIVEMPDMDSVVAGTAPVMFGDLSGYRIFDRVDLSVLRDPYTLGTKGQVRFIAHKRIGADLIHADRLVKLRVAA